jgi:pilus assembly protein CpaB
MVQKSRAIAYLVLAVLAAVAAVLLTRSLVNESNRSAAKPPPPQTDPVVVASEPLQAGSALRADQLGVVQWPREFLPRGAFASPEQLAGRVLERSLEEREPVLEAVLRRAPRPVSAR